MGLVVWLLIHHLVFLLRKTLSSNSGDGRSGRLGWIGRLALAWFIGLRFGEFLTSKWLNIGGYLLYFLNYSLPYYEGRRILNHELVVSLILLLRSVQRVAFLESVWRLKIVLFWVRKPCAFMYLQTIAWLHYNDQILLNSPSMMPWSLALLSSDSMRF